MMDPAIVRSNCHRKPAENRCVSEDSEKTNSRHITSCQPETVDAGLAK